MKADAPLPSTAATAAAAAGPHLHIKLNIEGQGGLCQQIALKEGQEAVQARAGRATGEVVPTRLQQLAHQPEAEVAVWRVQPGCHLRRLVAKLQQQVQRAEDHPVAAGSALPAHGIAPQPIEP